MTRRCCWSSAFIVLVVATAATAQTTQKIQPPPSTPMWQHGSTLNLFGGTASAPSHRAAIGGGAVGWELKPRFAVEGSGEWMKWGAGSHAFAAAITVQTGLAGPRPLMPFLTGGIGLYRASFARIGSAMPAFYARRISTDGMSMGTTATFTDPTVVFGGGVNAFISRHWAVRPDVREMVVLRNSRSYFVTDFAVHLAYHFEDHPITPKVR
jgi:hypothetical protein